MKPLVAALAFTLSSPAPVSALPLAQDAAATKQAPPEAATDAAKSLLERARTRYQSTQIGRASCRERVFVGV